MLKMFEDDEEVRSFDGFIVENEDNERRPGPPGDGRVLDAPWRTFAGESDNEEEDFLGFSDDGSDIDVSEIESENGSESESESDDDEGLVEWKDNLITPVNVEDFTANSGPCHRLGSDAFPKDFFDLFFGDDIFDHIVRATIAYARTKHGNEQFTTDRAEISAFFGLNILIPFWVMLALKKRFL